MGDKEAGFLAGRGCPPFRRRSATFGNARPSSVPLPLQADEIDQILLLTPPVIETEFHLPGPSPKRFAKIEGEVEITENKTPAPRDCQPC